MKNFIQTINVFQYTEFRDRVVEACNVSQATWSNWKNGGAVSLKYQSIIDGIAKEMFGRAVFGKESEK